MTATTSLATSVSIALWATDLGVPVSDIAGWAAHIDKMMSRAKEQGANIFQFPEYAAEQWMAFRPEGLLPHQEMAWLADQAPEACKHALALARKHDMLLLAGSMPWHIDANDKAKGQTNSAMIFTPEGQCIIQDKLSLTPGEQDPENWNLTPGQIFHILEWRGLKIASLICLDIEMPALSCLMAPLDLDLVMVPSMTSSIAGYHRVFGCAKARAVELMCAISVCGTTGAALNTSQNPINYSGCSVFIPCEPELGHTGIFAETKPGFGKNGTDGELLVVSDIPVGKIRSLRKGDAEVWPGGWKAGHIQTKTVSVS